MFALTSPDKCEQVGEAISKAGGKVTITKPTKQGLKLH
jgi:mevalonate kinase